MDPGGGESGLGKRFSAADLGPVTLAELLHLVPALGRRLGRGRHWATAGHGIGDLLPVVDLESGAAEGVPLLSVDFDQGRSLVRGPARRRGSAGVDGSGSVCRRGWLGLVLRCG